MGREVHHALDIPHRSILNELGRHHGGLHVQTLREIHHVATTGLRHFGANRCQLLQGREGTFVGEVIFPRFHHPNSDAGALIGDCGGGDEFDVGVGEDGFK